MAAVNEGGGGEARGRRAKCVGRESGGGIVGESGGGEGGGRRGRAGGRAGRAAGGSGRLADATRSGIETGVVYRGRPRAAAATAAASTRRLLEPARRHRRARQCGWGVWHTQQGGETGPKHTTGSGIGRQRRGQKVRASTASGRQAVQGGTQGRGSQLSASQMDQSQARAWMGHRGVDRGAPRGGGWQAPHVTVGTTEREGGG